VITQLGIYGFDQETKRLQLLAVHPGVTVQDIKANSSFEILIPQKVQVTQPPTEEERRLLHEIDPTGMAIGK
jgi:acyl CoA:acetate/3-ketoacid CoA transferase beta subunit